jgi:pimeloyl-ACP methyl ester carboxylesterase
MTVFDLPDLAWAGLLAIGLGAVALIWSRHADRRAEELAPALGAFIEVAGTRFHYLDRGSGPPIVLIHGLGAQMRNFSYALLDRLTDTHRVILIDRPGSGYSTSAPDAYSGIIDQAASIAALLDALDVRRPLIVGHSFGGAVALALGLYYPERVSGLALLAPLSQPVDGIPEGIAGWLAKAHGLRRFGARLAAFPISRLLAKRLRGNAFAPDPMPADFAEAGGMILALRSSNLARTAFEVATINRDMLHLAGRYSELSVPISVLFGRDDQVLDPAIHGELLASGNPAVVLDLIAGGHMLPVTAPEQTAAWIKRNCTQAASESRSPNERSAPSASRRPETRQ